MPAEHTTPAVSPDTAELARMRAELREILDDLASYEGTSCQGWGCPGPAGVIVPMETCLTCVAQIRIRELLADTDTPEAAEASPRADEPEPERLVPELVIHHERYFATWPAGSRRVAVYADVADWTAGGEPSTTLAIPLGTTHSGGYLAALMLQWMRGATLPPSDAPD